MPPVEARLKLGSRALWPLAALLIAALLLVGLTSSASAGSGGEGTAVAAKKKKCKRHSKGKSNASKRRRCGRKKPGSKPGTHLPTLPSVPSPGGSASLSISPPGANFGDVEHGNCDPNCP